MKKVLVSLLVSLAIISPIFIRCAQLELEKEFERKKSMDEVTPDAPRRILLMFLDDSEKALKQEDIAIGVDLITALRQKAAPILVSRHLLSVLNEIYTPFGLAQDMPITMASDKDQQLNNWVNLLNKNLKNLSPNFQNKSKK